MDARVIDGAHYGYRLAAEIDQPHAIFQRQLNENIRMFAYPYGDSSQLAVKMLRDRSYGLAVTVTRGANASFGDPLMLKRDMVYGNATMQDFQKYLSVYSRVNLK